MVNKRSILWLFLLFLLAMSIVIAVSCHMNGSIKFRTEEHLTLIKPNGALWNREFRLKNSSCHIAGYMRLANASAKVDQSTGVNDTTGNNGTPLLSHPGIPRAMSGEKYNEYIDLIEALAVLLETANITYGMCDGTLLGSFMMHDMIPWDDDVDMMISRKDMNKTLDVIRGAMQQGEFEAMNFWEPNTDFGSSENQIPPNYDKRSHQFKFYRSDSPHAGTCKWKWPFIDVKFFRDNATHVWLLDKVNCKTSFYTKRTTFYPLHRRPFGRLWLPAPADTRQFLADKFKTFKCKSKRWNHAEEKGQKAQSEPCPVTDDCYPLVDRTRLDNGTLETLVLQGQPLRSVFVNEPFYHNKKSHEL